MGVTGKAIENKKVVIAPKGELDSSFAPEVDNFSSVGTISNMMAGPMINLNGDIMGVVQLFNKESPEEDNQITQRDQEELNCILVSLGEIVQSANSKYEFTKLC